MYSKAKKWHSYRLTMVVVFCTAQFIQDGETQTFTVDRMLRQMMEDTNIQRPMGKSSIEKNWETMFYDKLFVTTKAPTLYWATTTTTSKPKKNVTKNSNSTAKQVSTKIPGKIGSSKTATTKKPSKGDKNKNLEDSTTESSKVTKPTITIDKTKTNKPKTLSKGTTTRKPTPNKKQSSTKNATENSKNKDTKSRSGVTKATSTAKPMYQKQESNNAKSSPKDEVQPKSTESDVKQPISRENTASEEAQQSKMNVTTSKPKQKTTNKLEANTSTEIKYMQSSNASETIKTIQYNEDGKKVLIEERKQSKMKYEKIQKPQRENKSKQNEQKANKNTKPRKKAAKVKPSKEIEVHVDDESMLEQMIEDGNTGKTSKEKDVIEKQWENMFYDKLFKTDKTQKRSKARVKRLLLKNYID